MRRWRSRIKRKRKRRREEQFDLDELPLVVEHAALADLVDDLQPVVLGLGEQDGGPVDVGLALHRVLVLQVQPAG